MLRTSVFDWMCSVRTVVEDVQPSSQGCLDVDLSSQWSCRVCLEDSRDVIRNFNKWSMIIILDRILIAKILLLIIMMFKNVEINSNRNINGYFQKIKNMHHNIDLDDDIDDDINLIGIKNPPLGYLVVEALSTCSNFLACKFSKCLNFDSCWARLDSHEEKVSDYNELLRWKVFTIK